MVVSECVWFSLSRYIFTSLPFKTEYSLREWQLHLCMAWQWSNPQVLHGCCVALFSCHQESSKAFAFSFIHCAPSCRNMSAVKVFLRNLVWERHSFLSRHSTPSYKWPGKNFPPNLPALKSLGKKHEPYSKFIHIPKGKLSSLLKNFFILFLPVIIWVGLQIATQKASSLGPRIQSSLLSGISNLSWSFSLSISSTD